MILENYLLRQLFTVLVRINPHQSIVGGKGSISAEIDHKTGQLTRAVHVVDWELKQLSHHPDTGTSIVGVQIPTWDEHQDTLLKLARVVHHLPYLAWDLVITDDGMQVLEANSNPGTSAIQAHDPLLINERTRKFFEHHDIV